MRWAQHWLAGMGLALFLAGTPASTNYSLQSYGIGTGGTADSSSSNYKVNGLTGQLAGKGSSAHYTGGFGLNYHMQGNVPTLTLTNDDNWYDKLHLTLDPAGNPTNTKYLIAISTDGFATTQYLANDLTITSTLSSSDYMTYTELGSAAGVILRGLTPSTVYSAQADALRDGAFTETGLGPVTTGATVSAQISFRLDVGPTYAPSSPPYILDLGALLPGSVITSSDKIWTTLSTNADNGGYIYADGLNGGLTSQSTGYHIASSSGDLATLAEGFGEQEGSVTQTAGGPMAKNATYNVGGTNVGQDYTELGEMFTTSGAPVTSGVGSVVILGKAGAQTYSAADYTETITLVAAGSF